MHKSYRSNHEPHPAPSSKPLPSGSGARISKGTAANPHQGGRPVPTNYRHEGLPGHAGGVGAMKPSDGHSFGGANIKGGNL